MIDKPWGPAEWRTNADELEAIANDLEEAARILAKYQEPVHGLPTRILGLRNSARLDREYAETLEPAVSEHVAPESAPDQAGTTGTGNHENGRSER